MTIINFREQEQLNYDWVYEFGWNDISNILNPKSVHWSDKITVYNDNNCKSIFDLKSFNKHRRPCGSKPCKAGISPLLLGNHRLRVHQLRPDLKLAPGTLQQINFKIMYDESDLSTRKKIDRSIRIFETKLIPLAKTYIFIQKEKERFDLFVRNLDYW